MADMASEGRRSGTSTTGAAEAGSTAIACKAQGVLDAPVILQHCAAWGHIIYRITTYFIFVYLFIHLFLYIYIYKVHIYTCAGDAGWDQRDLELCSIAQGSCEPVWSCDPICAGPIWSQLFDPRGLLKETEARNWAPGS